MDRDIRKQIHSALKKLSSIQGSFTGTSRKILLLAVSCALLVIFTLYFSSDSLEDVELAQASQVQAEHPVSSPAGETVTRPRSNANSERETSAGGLQQTDSDWIQSVESREQSKRGASARRGDRNYRSTAELLNRYDQANLANAPLDSDPAAAISGQVIAETGEPLAGIRVSARAQRLFESEGGTTGTTTEQWTLSNNQGYYRFGELDLGEYRIRSEATDGFAMAQTFTRTGTDSANLVMAAEHVCWVYGRVTNNRRQPVEGVKVSARGQHSRTTSTNQSGDYELQLTITGQGLMYQLQFELEGYRKSTLNLQAAELFERNEIRLDTVLEKAAALATVAGSVSDKRGTPLGGERIYLSGPTNYRATTDQAGEFAIPNVEANGTYQLSVHSRGPYRKYVQKIRVSPKGLDVNIQLEALDYASLSGSMVDPSGNPIANFSLRIYSTTASAHQLLINSDEAGRFIVDQVPTGQLIFNTRSYPRFTISGINLPPEGLENVELILDLGSYQVVGRVVDKQGFPVATPYVNLNGMLQKDGVRYHSARQTASDADGFFRFTDIGSGSHTVSVRALGFRNTALEYNVDGHAEELVVQLERSE